MTTIIWDTQGRSGVKQNKIISRYFFQNEVISSSLVITENLWFMVSVAFAIETFNTEVERTKQIICKVALLEWKGKLTINYYQRIGYLPIELFMWQAERMERRTPLSWRTLFPLFTFTHGLIHTLLLQWFWHNSSQEFDSLDHCMIYRYVSEYLYNIFYQHPRSARWRNWRLKIKACRKALIFVLRI